MQIINKEDISKIAISCKEIYDIVSSVFIQHGQGHYENPPKQAIHTFEKSFYHAMPAYLPDLNIAGTKLVGVYPNNPNLGLESLSGIIVMIDTKTGLPNYILDAEFISNMRTAIVTCVASNYLSRVKDNYLIIGSGAQAKYHIQALSSIYPGCNIVLNSRNENNCKILKESMRDYNCNVSINMDLHDATLKADNIIVCTSKLLSPILNEKDLKDGVTVFNVHALGWSDDILKYVDKVFTDDKEQILDIHNGISYKYSGLDMAKEFGEYMLHDATHIGADDVVFCFNYGLGIFDIAVANYFIKELNEINRKTSV